jgi:recombination protein RecA
VGSLSEAQHSLITGTLLGDGAMRCKANALLEINHSAHQRSYVDWKFQLLADLVSTPPKLRQGNGGRMAYRFTTRSLPQLTSLYGEFYRDGGKHVPKMELTPLALAVWFMDDGSRSRSSVYLNTQQFDIDCQVLLLSLLWEQWGIEAALNRDKQYMRIRVTTGSVGRLARAIEPYLLPEFSYKLPQ